MTGTRVGYARCTIEERKFIIQHGVVRGLEVALDRIAELITVSRLTVYCVLDRAQSGAGT